MKKSSLIRVGKVGARNGGGHQFSLLVAPTQVLKRRGTLVKQPLQATCPMAEVFGKVFRFEKIFAEITGPTVQPYWYQG